MDDSFDDFKNLPADIRDRFWSFLRIDDEGIAHVADRDGFVDFLYENAQQYPVLSEFLKLNEEKLTQHFHVTGEVRPGVELIKTEQAEGQNVTKLRIFRGPTIVPEDER